MPLLHLFHWQKHNKGTIKRDRLSLVDLPRFISKESFNRKNQEGERALLNFDKERLRKRNWAEEGD